MPKLGPVRAYVNNEIVYIAWALDEPIKNCRGFDVKRVDVATGAEVSLPAWVPFEGQQNTNWMAHDTSEWPIQRLSWKDLTWRDELDKQLGNNSDVMHAPPFDHVVRYKVVPMIGPAKQLTAAGDMAALSNPVHLAINFGSISAAFNNGLLSTQWLTNELKKDYGADKPLAALKQAIASPGNPIRTKLAGDALPFLRLLLERAKAEGGSVLLALYELTDPDLIQLILDNRQRVQIILSNTSADKSKKVWDGENEPVRAKLHKAGVRIQDRMFNNDHIGHNKFCVLLDKSGKAVAVLTGSTNWTQNGLCAQSNNAILIESADVAGAYQTYWKNLLADRLPLPSPMSEGTNNVQGAALRRADATPHQFTIDSKVSVQTWFSPNTVAATKNANSPTPPDLAQLYALMRQAKEAIFFLVFLPGMHGNQSIIEQAIQLGNEDPSLLVLGAISSGMAMPETGPAVAPSAAPAGSAFLVNSRRKAGRSKPPRQSAATGSANGGGTSPVFKQNATEVVLASALHQGDLVGEFEAELLSAGNAIIHDKIVVIDPLSDSPVVACGSHNLGYKASYGNDENLLVIRGNQPLALAYAVHVIDVYDHYRFRAEQQASGGKAFSGFLQDSDSWQQDYIDGRRGTDAKYFARP